MQMRRLLTVVLAAGLMLGACDSGGSDDDESAAGAKAGGATSGDEASGGEGSGPSKPTPLDLVAVDYAFKAPDTIKGGLVSIDYVNNGLEPHFAAFARLNPGQTFDDAKAFLTTPPDPDSPGGPPPFVEFAGMPTADPGQGGNMTVNLPAGEYVLLCMVASPDGVPHGAKGMLRSLEVTEGEPGPLPEAEAGRFTDNDFTIGGLGIVEPRLEVGNNTVSLHNSGKQLHEINLIELPAGKTVEDVVAWAAKAEGPPPARFLSGLAVAPGETGVGRINLGRGKTYAFVCMIPDSLGDFAPHILKGMYTRSFTLG